MLIRSAFAFVLVLLVAWFFRCILQAPVVDVSTPSDWMTPEEQEALENKARLQREMHERGRNIKKNLEARLK
jgi:hypothetical protein